MPSIARSLAWDDLRLIHVIAEARTLPQAAARLGLDHSTVFRRLRQIETALGTPVFERHRGGYVPTAAGVEIIALAGRVEDDITSVLRRVSGQSPSPAGEVRVATNDAMLVLLLPILTAFHAAYPEVRLDIVTGNMPVNLSRRDADVAIRATASPPDTLVGRKVARIAWAAYGATPASSLAMGEAGLVGIQGAWVGFGDALHGLAAHALLASVVPAPRVACRFDTIGGLAAGVAAGLGTGLLPCFVGDGRAGLHRVSGPIATLATDLWLLTHVDLRQVPRVRVLLDFLAARLGVLRDLIEGAGG